MQTRRARWGADANSARGRDEGKGVSRAGHPMRGVAAWVDAPLHEATTVTLRVIRPVCTPSHARAAGVWLPSRRPRRRARTATVTRAISHWGHSGLGFASEVSLDGGADVTPWMLVGGRLGWFRAGAGQASAGAAPSQQPSAPSTNGAPQGERAGDVMRRDAATAGEASHAPWDDRGGRGGLTPSEPLGRRDPREALGLGPGELDAHPPATGRPASFASSARSAASSLDAFAYERRA